MMPKPKAGTTNKPAISPRPRRADGQPKPDLHAEKRKAPALVRRIMDHAVKMGLDKRVTTVLGRLHLEGVLTDTEMAAGLLYAETVGQYEAIMGHPRRAAASASLEGGRNTAPKVDIEALAKIDPDAADKLKKKIAGRVKRIKTRYLATQACMPGAGKQHFDRAKGEWIEGKNLDSTIVEEVCCNDLPVQAIYHGRLKACLGRLAIAVYRITDTIHRTGATKSEPADARILSEAAVEALENWFAKRNATVTTYRLVAAQAWQARRIAAYGSTKTGGSLEHEIKVPRGTLMAEAIDAQLVKAADAKGWKEAVPVPRTVEVSADAVRAGITKLKPAQESA